MPLPFFLAGILGKAAVGAVAKGLVGKASAVGAKALVGHHAHHGVAQHVAKEIAEKLTDSAVDAAFAKKEKSQKREAP